MAGLFEGEASFGLDDKDKTPYKISTSSTFYTNFHDR